MAIVSEPKINAQISQKKSDLCNRWLLMSALLFAIVTPLLLYRDISVGDDLESTTILLLVVLVSILAIAAFRAVLPLWLRAFFPILMLTAISVFGVSSLGMVSPGFYFLLIAPSLVLVFYRFTPAILLLISTSLIAVGIGVLAVKTGVTGVKNPSEYLVSSAGWASYIGVFVFASTGLLATIHVLNNFFTEALVEQARESEKLANSERETRTILDQLVEPYFRVDREGRVVIISPAIETLLQRSPEDLLGETLADFSPDPAALAAFFDDVLKTTGKSELEAFLRREDGATRLVTIRAQPWQSRSGEPTGVEGVIIDITERRAARKAIYHSRKVAASGLMAAGIAHDFNNNLGVISGCLSSIAPHVEDNKELKNLVELANRANDKAIRLSGRLHQLSSKTSYDTEQHDVDAILEEFAPILFRILPRNIKLQTTFGEGAKYADINRSDFEDVIFNLVGNARDAISDTGSISIETSVVELDPQRLDTLSGALEVGSYICIAVQDTGKGVSKEIAQRLYEPFFSTKPEGQGSGLGLSMVRRFAERAGGCIRLVEPDAKGARFELYLPLREVRS